MADLITGGSGYIGSNLLKHLDDPIIFDLKNTHDILDTWSLGWFMSEADICYHLAAVSGLAECDSDPKMAFKTNVEGTFNVMQAASLHDVKVVFVSSFAVQGSSFYGLTKALGEEIVRRYGGVICRIANVYGGERFIELKDTAVARLMKGTFEDRGHGAEKRDFIHVEQVCRKLIEASTLPSKSTVDVCTGHRITIDDLIKLSESPQFPDNLRGERPQR